MKAKKIFYWLTTGLVSLMMAFSAYSYLANPHMKEAFKHLGFPDFFRVELAIAKILGAVALIVPGLPKVLKLFTYSGFYIVFISAIIAHASVGDAPFLPIAFILILSVSYYLYEKTASVKS